MPRATSSAGSTRSARPGATRPLCCSGSHLDTVPDAGRYDGIVGVLMALEVVRLLRTPTEDGGWRSPLPFALEVIAFSDEEGTRFGKALLGSSAVAGRLGRRLVDPDGCRGHHGSRGLPRLRPRPRPRSARRRGARSELVGYLEAHIEQGPELDRRGESLAVVSSIASARRFQLRVDGQARHAGGTPYDMRRDALLGASEAALAVERICRSEHHIIGTVGQLEAFPGCGEHRAGRGALQPRPARRVRRRARPGVARDLARPRRDHGPARPRLERARGAQRAARSSAPRCCRTSSARASSRRWMARALSKPGVRGGAPSSTDEPATIFSRAGHDGMAIGAVTDVGMLFLRNPDGISHHPDEAVSTGDVELGIRALAESVLHLAAEPAPDVAPAHRAAPARVPRPAGTTAVSARTRGLGANPAVTRRGERVRADDPPHSLRRFTPRKHQRQCWRNLSPLLSGSARFAEPLGARVHPPECTTRFLETQAHDTSFLSARWRAS